MLFKYTIHRLLHLSDVGWVVKYSWKQRVFLDRSRKLCVDEIFNAVFISALSMNTQTSDSWLALDTTDWDLFSVVRLSKWVSKWSFNLQWVVEYLDRFSTDLCWIEIGNIGVWKIDKLKLKLKNWMNRNLLLFLITYKWSIITKTTLCRRFNLLSVHFSTECCSLTL